MNLSNDGASPIDSLPSFHLLAKPSGSTCNIDCKYCFFLSKDALYPNDKQRMSEETLETYIRQLLESHRTPTVTVAWQGGEPTLMKLDFFKRSLEIVEKYRRPSQKVQHTFQTNGILLDDEWCDFLQAKQLSRRPQCRRPTRNPRRQPARPWRAGYVRPRDERLAPTAQARRRLQHSVYRERRQRETRSHRLSFLSRRDASRVDSVHPHRRARHRGHDQYRESWLGREARPTTTPLHAIRQHCDETLSRGQTIWPLSHGYL